MQYKNKKQQKKPAGKSKGEGEEPKAKTASKVICWNCGENGHKRPECKKPRKDKKKEEEEEEADELFLITDDAQEDLSLAAMERSSRDKGWYVNSGATKHMCNQKEWYEKLENVDASTSVTLGDNSKCAVKGKGAIPITTTEGSTRALENVLYIPNLCKNLLSVSAMTKQKMKVEFDESEVLIKDKTQGNKVIARGEEKNGLYRITDFAGIAHEDDSHLWHQRMGHLNYTSLANLKKEGMVTGLPAIQESTAVCEGCMLVKQHRSSFSTHKPNRASKPLELVHSDVCGPMKTTSIAGSRYFLTFIDDFTRHIWVYFLKEKSQVLNKFKEFKARAETQSGGKIKVLRIDRGGEFETKEFRKFVTDQGIQRQLTTTNTPQQNGVAERKNRTIVEMARSMMKAKNLKDDF